MENNFEGLKVMVIDDSKTIRRTAETLLQKATGWQAPISQMPYWISGRSAPSDSAPQLDSQGRLISSINGDWTASFSYKGNDKLPNKISAMQPAGHKVVMTINHQNQ